MICHRRGNSQADANKRHNAHYGQCPAFHLVFLRIRSLQTHQTHCLDPTLWRGDGRPHEGPQHTLGGHLSAISAYLIAPKSIVSRIIISRTVSKDVPSGAFLLSVFNMRMTAVRTILLDTVRHLGYQAPAMQKAIRRYAQ